MVVPTDASASARPSGVVRHQDRRRLTISTFRSGTAAESTPLDLGGMGA